MKDKREEQGQERQSGEEQEKQADRRGVMHKDSPKRRAEDYDFSSDPEKLEHLTEISDL